MMNVENELGDKFLEKLERVAKHLDIITESTMEKYLILKFLTMSMEEFGIKLSREEEKKLRRLIKEIKGNIKAYYSL